MKKWTADMDKALVEAVEGGLSLGQAAKLIGVTRNACIGRWHRIRGHVFASDLARRAEVEARYAKRVREIKNALRSVQGIRDRNAAILMAYMRGATMEAIGDHFGLTHQRVSQIVDEIETRTHR